MLGSSAHVMMSYCHDVMMSCVTCHDVTCHAPAHEEVVSGRDAPDDVLNAGRVGLQVVGLAGARGPGVLLSAVRASL